MTSQSAFGIYRGVVVQVDKTPLRRLRVTVPLLMGAHSVWAFPCVPLEEALSPQETAQAGDSVWVMFEGGDLNYPVWVGFSPPMRNR